MFLWIKSHSACQELPFWKKKKKLTCWQRPPNLIIWGNIPWYNQCDRVKGFFSTRCTRSTSSIMLVVLFYISFFNLFEIMPFNIFSLSKYKATNNCCWYWFSSPRMGKFSSHELFLVIKQRCSCSSDLDVFSQQPSSVLGSWVFGVDGSRLVGGEITLR